MYWRLTDFFYFHFMHICLLYFTDAATTIGSLRKLVDVAGYVFPAHEISEQKLIVNIVQHVLPLADGKNPLPDQSTLETLFKRARGMMEQADLSTLNMVSLS